MSDIMKELNTYEEIKKVLSEKGSKAAVAIQGRPDIQIFAVKSDLIAEMDIMAKDYQQTGPLDYDGDPVYFLYSEKDKIVYVDGGI